MVYGAWPHFLTVLLIAFHCQPVWSSCCSLNMACAPSRLAMVLPISFSWSHFPPENCVAVTSLSLSGHHLLMRLTLTSLVKIPFPYIPLPCFEFYLCTSSYLLTNYIFYLFILHIVFALHTHSQEILKQFIVWERLPWWLSNKESTCDAGATENAGLIPGSGRSPGGGHGNPLQYSCLGNPCTEEPGGLQSMGLQRVGHDWSNLAHMQSLGSSSFDRPAFRVRLHPVIEFGFTLWIGRAMLLAPNLLFVEMRRLELREEGHGAKTCSFMFKELIPRPVSLYIIPYGQWL